MATRLMKPVSRRTSAKVFHAGQDRDVVATLEPGRSGDVLALRLNGIKGTYRLKISSLFTHAVDSHLLWVENRAKQISKNLKIPMRSARAKAREEAKDRIKK